MKEIRYKDSWVKFCDCVEGMKTLPDKSIDLAITDYPFTIDIKNSLCDKKKVFYEDTKTDIYGWFDQWFNEMRRISNTTIIYAMKKHTHYWVSKEPTDYLYCIKLNSQSGGSTSHFQRVSPIFVYGNKMHKLNFDYFITIVNNGWNQEGYIHPCPLSSSFWYDLISPLKPLSILDPFMGSGTTLEVAIQIGVPCYGFELVEEYTVDIEKRIEKCKYLKRPTTLNSFLGTEIIGTKIK